ncbi:MAG: hypothetical protein COA99_02730 [Moraxellaceae bacterium]|nr:MAG: hypothetical protein COA99_02730 [Moraxellaceae bacterium]
MTLHFILVVNKNSYTQYQYTCPPKIIRSRLALTLAERDEISRGIAADLSIRSIDLELGRSPSTVSG